MKSILENLKHEFEGKKVLVVGLGLHGGGIGVAKFFSKLGAKVKITDQKNKDDLQESIDKIKDYPITLSLGGHKLEDFLEAEVIFKGPSVSWMLPEIVEAQKRGIRIEMETSFFASCQPAKIIGVAGTRGKSTTSNLIYEALKANGKSCYLTGNIPNSTAIDLLDKINKNDIVVLELSSWQLSGFHKKKLSPHIAVFTNFYPDHLNYYKNTDDYFFDKKAIYLYQKKEDYLIANESLKERIEKDHPISHIEYSKKEDYKGNLKYLRGGHNLENAAEALHVSQILNLEDQKSKEAIENYKGLKFRQEIVREIDGVIFINDSTSTTPVATLKALETFKEHPIILLLGGNAKNLPYGQLIEKLELAEKIILLTGSFTNQILPYLESKYKDKVSPIFEDLQKAVVYSMELAKSLKGTRYILFSPGATSFAMFKNEFHRGEEFERIVKGI